MEILIVDNDPLLLKFLERLFAQQGHTVLVAEDGLSALDAVRSVVPDFIFVDYVMPNIDGLALCRMLKNMPALERTFVVLLSAVAAEEWANIGAIGADACVAKVPFGKMKHYLSELIADPAAAAAFCADGRVIGLDAVSPRLITRELLDSKKHFMTLLDRMDEGVLELNARGRIVYANPAILEMLGKPAAEIMGITLGDVFDESQHALLEDSMDAARLPSNGTERSGPVRHNDLYLTLRSVPLDTADGHLIVILDDISAYVKSERALKSSNASLNRSRENYKQIFDVAPAGIYEIDYRTVRLTRVNDAICEYTGYSREELLRIDPFDLLTDENKSHHRLLIERIQRGEKVPHFFEYEAVKKNGETFWVNLNVRYIRKGGEIVGATVVAQDVTQIKRVEQEKDRLQWQLQQSQKLEAIGTLAGGVAHDFNNLLMGIQGNASLAMMDIGSEHPAYNYMKSIENFVNAGANLTRQLLGFAKGGQYDVQPTDINALIHQTADMFGRTHKQVHVHESFEPTLWPAAVDRVQMAQALLNIFVNASQAMSGSGKLTITTGNRRLTAHDIKDHDMAAGRYVYMAVRDTGIGMPPAVTSKVFDPFFTTKNRGKEKGAGLGLASVYGIVKSHGGMIRVDSEPGKGTIFDILLPACDAAPSDVPADGPAPTPDPGKGTILVIEDEELVLEVAVNMLENLGYQVLSATGGGAALEIFRQKHETIDLVLLDMIMPEMHGSLVFDRMKAIDPGCRVLLCSGYSLDGEAKEILDRGCKGFIQKPYSLDLLATKIREIIG